MKLSVCIVTCGRLDLFRECCESVLRALPPDSEVVVILNGVGPDEEEFLKRLDHPFVRWVRVSRESLGSARNRAFILCKGEIIYYLDDDVTVPSSLFNLTLEKFKKDPSLAVLGGPNLTPPESSRKEKIFGAVMTSAFAAPMVRSRYSSQVKTWGKASEHRLIFCNLACRPTLIPWTIRFPSDFISNQENLFLFRCEEQELRIGVCQEMFVYHRRRKDLKGFVTQIASYGCGRFQQTKSNWKSCHPLFLAPLISILAISVLGIMSEWQIVITALFAYFGIALFSAASSSEIRGLGRKAILQCSVLTGIVHLAYAWGWLRGIWVLGFGSRSRKKYLFGNKLEQSLEGISPLEATIK